MTSNLHELRSIAQTALNVCQSNHLNVIKSYNMNVSAASVSRVGVEIDEHLNMTYFVEVDEADCRKLEQDMSEMMRQHMPFPVAVRSEW